MLINQLLTNQHINEDMKKALRGSTVVEATHVSNHYYQGTGQEIWDLTKDFPNIAPPFESFFLEFNAPYQIVSEQHGTILWSSLKDAPLAWGALCQGVSHESSKIDVRTEIGKEHFIENVRDQIAQYEGGFEPIAKQYPSPGTENREKYAAWFLTLPEEIRAAMEEYRKVRNLLQLIQQNKWDRIAYLLDQISFSGWTMSLTAFTKFRSSSLQSFFWPFCDMEGACEIRWSHCTRKRRGALFETIC